MEDTEDAGPSAVKSEPDEFMYQLESSALNFDSDDMKWEDHFEQEVLQDNESNSTWTGDSEIDDNSSLDEIDKIPVNMIIRTDEIEMVNKRRRAEPVELIINWDASPANIRQIPFAPQPGLQVLLPYDGKPIDYFYMFADDHFFELVCAETNAHAEEIFLEKGEGRITSWRDVGKDEFKVFLGLLFHMGTIQCYRIEDYWKTHRLFGIPSFHKYMKRNRFLLILKCLYFGHSPTNEEPADDSLFKVKPIINYFNEKMASIFTPHKQLYLEEPMVIHRGRLLFQRCVKKESYNYGMKKLYMLIDSSGLIVNLAVCTGIMDNMGGPVHSSKIVLNLMRKKLNLGYSLHMDKFYNSYSLAKKLLGYNTYCTGVLHAGRRDIPEDVAKAKLNTGETICRYAEGVIIGKWYDKRDFLYLSTEHDNEMVIDTNYKRDSKNKPKPIVEFNKYVPSVDVQEQMMSYYPFSRKTLGWYKKLCFHIIHMMVFNAFMLYNKHSGKKMFFYDFRLSIVEDLLPPDNVAPGGSNKKPPKQTLLEHFPIKCQKNQQGRAMRRRCKFCFSKNLRKDTQYLCGACPGTPGLCLEPCFRDYHEDIKL